MIILGIETSCDETAAAVVKNGSKILSTVTATSAGVHAKTGGVIPEDAARKQIKSILPVINLALEQAELKVSEIDSIAVTTGPGLIGSLLAGVETAKTLAFLTKKPIVPVNHLVGHLYANWLVSKERSDDGLPEFSALGLVVSGGHTDLVLMSGHGKIKWIGGTRDDAAGEAFDKTARLLGCPYPGGPSLAKIADNFISDNPGKKLKLFPRPMISTNDFDWSFSGLKTAVLNKIKEETNIKNLADYKKVPKHFIDKKQSELAAEIQEAIVDVIVKKSLKAIKKYQPKSFLLAGGVAANKRLRERFTLELQANKKSPSLHIPPIEFCTDNATYIAAAAFYNHHPVPWQKISPNPQLSITD